MRFSPFLILCLLACRSAFAGYPDVHLFATNNTSEGAWGVQFLVSDNGGTTWSGGGGGGSGQLNFPAYSQVAFDSTCCNGEGTRLWKIKYGPNATEFSSGSQSSTASCWPSTCADYLYFSPAGATVWRIDKNICNNSQGIRTYEIATNGTLSVTVTLGPGGCYLYSYSGPAKIPITITDKIHLQDGDGDVFDLDKTADLATTGDAGWHSTGGSSPNDAPGPEAAPPKDTQSATNLSIEFPTQPTNGLLATEATLKIGTAAIQKAVVAGALTLQSTIAKAAQTASIQAAALDPRPNIDAVGTKVDSAKTAITNYLGTSITAENAVKDKVEEVRVAVTNSPRALEVLATNRLYDTGLATSVQNATNSSWLSGLANSAAASNSVRVGVTAIGSAPDVDADPGAPDGLFNFSIGGFAANFDPLSNSSFAAAATFIRALIYWAATLGFLVAVWASVHSSLKGWISAPQATGNKQQILGFNLSAPLAVAAAVAVFFVITGVTTSIAGWLNGNLGLLELMHTSPLASAGVGPAFLRGALHLLTGFVPCGAIITYAVSYFIQSMTNTAMMVGAATLIRFVIG